MEFRSFQLFFFRFEGYPSLCMSSFRAGFTVAVPLLVFVSAFSVKGKVAEIAVVNAMFTHPIVFMAIVFVLDADAACIFIRALHAAFAHHTGIAIGT